MPKGFQSQQCQRYGRYGLEWTASFCCPWLFKAPVVAVPDNSPKDHAEDSKAARTPDVPEFYMEGMDTPEQTEQTDARDLIHANFCAFQEQNQIFAPAAPLPLPVLVVTGFLGSGKTTLVKKLMQRRGNLRVAAVAHDLAATINVDAAFLASMAEVQRGLGKGESLFQQTMAACRDGDVAALSGCVCCPGFDDALSTAVRNALTQGADTGLLDYLVLETSGAADPRQIVGALEVRFGPLARVRLDRVVTVVDAERVVAEGHQWEEAQDGASHEDQLQLIQLSVADLVLLNKVDLISPEASASAQQLLQRLCPHAKVVACSHGDVPVPELLDVEAAAAVPSAAVSHEDNPACWKVSSNSLEATRPSHEGGFIKADMKIHHRVAEWSTRDSGSEPVRLARLQHLLCHTLPRLRRWLRRGKGVLRIGEDPTSRWDWELSGQMRFNLRRAPSTSVPWSTLVLIFSESVPDAEFTNILSVLSALGEPSVELPDRIPKRRQAFARELSNGKPAFEVLEAPEGAGNVLHFRLTGREHFSLPADLDLSLHPYRIDLNALNAELAQLVNSEKGPVFLGIGDGICPATKATVLCLLWPLDVPQSTAENGIPEVDHFMAMLTTARGEAPSLLTRHFSHVTSCHCGH